MRRTIGHVSVKEFDSFFICSNNFPNLHILVVAVFHGGFAYLVSAVA